MGGLKNFRTGGVTSLGGLFLLGGVSTPLHAMFSEIGRLDYFYA